MIRVLIADDHKILRQGLRALLESEPDIKIVGEASNGIEAVDLVQALQPNILVVDMRMPGRNGIEVIKDTMVRSPRTGIVVLSMYATTIYVSQAIQAGAQAYVLKDSSVSDLVDAIREVFQGRTYLSPGLSVQIPNKRIEENGDELYE